MILVFDIGTTVLKGALIDRKGTLRVHSRQSFASSLPLNSTDVKVHTGNHVNWLKVFNFVSNQVVKEYKKIEKRPPIEGVVISGNGPTFVPVTADGGPAGGIISWADMKSRIYIGELKNKIKGEVDPSFYLAKAYSFYKNNPAQYEKVKWFLPCAEYFSFFLTGNACAILPGPGYEKYMWTGDSIIRSGLDREKFPPFIKMGEKIGEVGMRVSKMTGIPPGIPVFAGGPDFIMSLLGTATISPGRVCDRTGTSEGINMCSVNPVDDEILFSVPHIIPGLYNISCVLNFAGKTLDWFLRLTGKDLNEYKKLYSGLAYLSPGPGTLIFLPHMGNIRTSLWPSHRKGIFIGLTGIQSHEDLFKAILEGLSYAIKDIFNVFEKKGFECEEVRVSGIQASYEEWNKIRANILGKRILVPAIPETELIGLACIGLTSCGLFSHFFKAAESLVRFEKEYLPDARLSRQYTRTYGLYRQAYKQTDALLQDIE